MVGGRGGIRRVARELANYALHSEGPSKLCPVFWGGSGFFRIEQDLTDKPHPLLIWHERLSRILGWVRFVMRGLWLSITFLIGLLVFPASALAALFSGDKLKDPRVYGRRLRRFVSDRLAFARSHSQSSHIVFGMLGIYQFILRGRFAVGRIRLQAHDTVVLVDSTWNAPEMEHYLIGCQKLGVRVGVMVHDVFPLTIPEMCEKSTVEHYVAWFERVMPWIDFCVTNSRATGRAVASQLCVNPTLRQTDLPSNHFVLGSSFAVSSKISESTAPELDDIEGMVILVVGTIEPRKNHSVVLDAFEFLQKRLDCSLVVIGQKGWHSDELLTRLNHHPEKGGRLRVFTQASDDLLAAAYQRADCLVCASWDEGFGLPLVEGILSGVKVLASDIEIFREVGGSFCEYFDPSDAESLAALIIQIASEEQVASANESVSQLSKYTITWRQSGAQFEQVVADLVNTMSPRNPIGQEQRDAKVV